MKKLRLDLQACMGMGDLFDEGADISEIGTVAVCDQVPVGVQPSDEMLKLSLRGAVLCGKLLEVVEKLNTDNAESSAKNFSQVLLSDIVTNPFANESRFVKFCEEIFFFFFFFLLGSLLILDFGKRFLAQVELL